MDSGQRPKQVYCLSGVTAECLDKGSGNEVKAEYLKACILKGDRVEGEAEEEGKEEQERLAFSAIEKLKEFQLIFAHPEALVGNKNVIKALKTAEFRNRMKAIVVDEAHLVVDW